MFTQEEIDTKTNKLFKELKEDIVKYSNDLIKEIAELPKDSDVLNYISDILIDEYQQITAWRKECKETNSIIEQACYEGKLSEILRIDNMLRDDYTTNYYSKIEQQEQLKQANATVTD